MRRGTHRALLYNPPVAVVGGGGFTPASVTQAVSWWDASVTADITGTAPVTAWADKIGSNNMGTGFWGNGGPTSGSLTVNSLNTISTLVSDASKVLGVSIPASQRTAAVLYVVAQIDAVDATDCPFLSVGDASAAQTLVVRAGNASVFQLDCACASIGATSFGNSGNHGGLHTFRFDWDTAGGGPMAVYKDGASTFTTTGFTGFSATSRIGLFANSYDSTTSSVRICEVVLCSAAPSAGDNTSLLGYWQTKWGTP